MYNISIHISLKFQFHFNFQPSTPMAEVSTFHHHQPNNVEEEEEEEEDSIPSWSNYTVHEEDLHAFDFDPLSPPNISFFIPSSTHSRHFSPCSDFDSESDTASDSNSFDGEDDQMNFVTELFASCEEEFVLEDQDSVSDPFLDAVTHDVNFRVFDGGDGIGSSYGEELGSGFGSGIEFDSVALVSVLGESSVTRGANSRPDGLRVAGIDSDSDSEEVVQDVNSGIHDDEVGPLGDLDIPLFWDCLGFEEQRDGNEELEWEEVNERVDEGLSSVIDRIEELSVSSEVSSIEETSDIGEEAVRNLEWEVLLAVNNLERAPEVEHDGISYLTVLDDDMLFGQFVQNESALKGSPPAAKSVMQNLPSVVLTKEELQENNVVCAVCKDDILVEEKVTRLPCCHHYHGDCIVPWLSIRNTCPVCRYELPTDDLDYEQRKTLRGGLGLSEDLQIMELIYRVVEGREMGV